MADIQRDVEQARAELGATVDELVHRVDVKARAREKTTRLKAQGRAKARRAGQTVAGQARVGAGAVVEAARRRDMQIAAGCAGLLALVLVVRARRG